MPKERKIIELIPKLYKAQALDLLMFAYVQGMQDALPAVSDDKALQMFYRKYGLTDDELNMDSARVFLVRMKRNFLEV